METEEFTKFSGTMALGMFWPLALFRSTHPDVEPHADDVKPYMWGTKKIFGVVLPDDGKPLPVPAPGEPGCIRLSQECGLMAVKVQEVENEA